MTMYICHEEKNLPVADENTVKPGRGRDTLGLTDEKGEGWRGVRTNCIRV